MNVNQVWVWGGGGGGDYIGESTVTYEALTYAYILLKSKLAESFSLKQLTDSDQTFLWCFPCLHNDVYSIIKSMPFKSIII